MSTDDTGDDTCPVCGQEYVHKRQDGPDRAKRLRDDYTECVRYPIVSGDPRQVYVHDTQRTVVNRVEREGSDEPSPLARIMGWDQ